MSLPERKIFAVTHLLRRAALCGLAAAAVLAAGCQVRPLYSDAPLSTNSTVPASAELASIAVKPVKTRYAQQVRNNLIFALNGGSERTTTPVYSLELGITELVESAATIQITTTEDEPTAGTVTLTSFYTLTDAVTGKKVASGRRSISSSYDHPRQEFAADRAQRDAEDRAARELADLLRLALAQDLAKLPSS